MLAPRAPRRPHGRLTRIHSIATAAGTLAAAALYVVDPQLMLWHLVYATPCPLNLCG